MSETGVETPIEVVELSAEDFGTLHRSSPRQSRATHLLAAVGGPLLLLILFLAAWELLARTRAIDTILFGSPSGVGTALVQYIVSPRFLASALDTGLAVILSFAIGCAAGIVFGLALGISPRLNMLLGPFLIPLNSIPRVALAPLFIAWFGLSLVSKVALGLTIVFFVVAETARAAILSVDIDLMTMGRVIGLSRVAIIRKIVVPSAVPSMFAAIRLSWVYSLLGVIASEMIAATRGIGQDIVFFSSSLQINSVFAILLILMVISFGVDRLLSSIERHLLRWQRS